MWHYSRYSADLASLPERSRRSLRHPEALTSGIRDASRQSTVSEVLLISNYLTQLYYDGEILV